MFKNTNHKLTFIKKKSYNFTHSLQEAGNQCSINVAQKIVAQKACRLKRPHESHAEVAGAGST